MRKFIRTLVILAMLGTLPAVGCGGPGIRLRPLRGHPAARGGVRSLIPGTSASASSEELAYSQSAAELEGSAQPAPARMLALADRADAIGARLIVNDPAVAIPWFREAAAYASFALIHSQSAGPDCPTQDRAIALHNHAVAELLRCAGSGPKNVNPAWREQLAGSGVRVVSTNPANAAIPCDELWIAADYRVTHLEIVGWPGLGVPLIALSEWPEDRAGPARFLPQRLRLPATAVLHPDGPIEGGAWRTQPATLVLHDPTQETTVLPSPATVQGAGGLPLAADLTTPLAHQVIVSPLKQATLGGLLQPETYKSAPGIFMRAPYQPGKIPVLFVHGLFSSPSAWLQITNELQADPLIRERYQFWYAYYPTGASVAFSAVRIRQTLHQLRDSIDPSHADRSLDQMVVVGHSLGGVLSKQMIQSSGRVLEQGLLTRPLDQVAMSQETRDRLSKMLYFEPEPSIARVVFICAPHRGSNTANQVIGRISSGLVERRGDAAAMLEEVIARNGPGVIQPAYRRRPPNSIDNLKYDSPVLRALSEMPISPGVPYHSIIATLFPVAPVSLWTDGVVSYESAHLDGAESEVVIRHSHLANETPEAAAEVHRILKLHIGISGS